MAMSVAEARSEIKSLYEKADTIEKKYDGEITNNEDLAEVKRLLTDIDSLEAKLTGLEDAEARKNRILSGLTRFNKPAPKATLPGASAEEIEEAQSVSPGVQFVQSRDYRDLKMNGHFNSNLSRVQFAVTLKDGTSLIEYGRQARSQKTLLYGSSATSGGGFVHNDIQPGYVDIRQRELTLLDLLPRVSTESDTIEYVYESTFTNAAAGVSEATNTTGTTGKKPQSALAYTVGTVPVETIAHWIPVTNRMLNDAPAIRGIIDGRLLLGLDLTLESECLSGNGTPPHLDGITHHAINVVGMGTDSRVDALFKGRTLVRTVGHGRPTAFVVAPADWEQIRLSRESAATATLGGYLMGPPSVAGATTLWGIPVIESEALSAGTGLVGDFPQGCTLFDREQAAIRVGTIDDQFIRNMQTILAELRAAFVVWRPTMFTEVTGI